MTSTLILCALFGLVAASSRYDHDSSRYDHDKSRYDGKYDVKYDGKYDRPRRYDDSRSEDDSRYDSRYDDSRYDSKDRYDKYDKARYDKSRYDKSRYEYQPRYDSKPSYGRYDRYDSPPKRDYGYDKSRYEKDTKEGGKKPKHDQFYYVGLYRGACTKDGLYYSNPFSFIVCTAGNHYVQPCSPGTRNRSIRNYVAGKHYGYTDFCSINLNDLGYSVNVNAGLHGYYPVKPLPPPRPHYPY